ncbi:hypothetical protein AFE_2592 [Acidithiobacillus ferrooxidans ATCC 23270]|uniref:Uncharacterized protein n=1 Tax=Acidithiobacillus ferrooxidans (strain ATCC 23270 / DSM 14882 / CIP 104768 / NCIMB 8455) TaxID=243159 RepID=B7J7Q9_ACIF2|nr:hypothetical protein AFE_2592 [Acidithiobacillus ferrooxidans ATCC 23270]
MAGQEIFPIPRNDDDGALRMVPGRHDAASGGRNDGMNGYLFFCPIGRGATLHE